MISFKQFLTEKKKYEIYHDSFTKAWQEVQDYVKSEGYTMNEEDVDHQVTFGGATGRARPAKGKTNRFKIQLLKDGKPTKKYVHFQVYGMPNSYELNMYIG